VLSSEVYVAGGVSHPKLATVERYSRALLRCRSPEEVTACAVAELMYAFGGVAERRTLQCLVGGAHASACALGGLIYVAGSRLPV
jgi:hypothetical protein